MQSSSPIVALAHCPDYTSGLLDDCINRLIAELSCPVNLRSCRILLKPNLISGKAGPLPCTDGRFMLAVARYFIDRGAKVFLGDSPAFGTAHQVLARLGFLDPLKGLGVNVIDFSSPRPIILPSGIRASLAADALDCDVLVNLPRVKAHAQMRCTLAVKNYYGCLVGMRKAWWHMIHGGKANFFSDLILELLTVLPPGLTLIDGVVAMHRSGPMNGDPYPLGIIGGAENPVALDRALLILLGIAADDSPLACAALRANIFGSSLDDHRYPLLNPYDIRVDDFLVPQVLDPVRFQPLRFCKSSLHRYLTRHIQGRG